MKIHDLIENIPAIDKEQIGLLLKQHFHIKGTVTISDQGIVSVAGSAKLKTKIKITELPVKFGTVDGDFDCSENRLGSLTGAPSHVGGHFKCNDNQLTSLAGAPNAVGGNFNCSDNQLTSLAGGPSSVDGDFDCGDNQLESLAGAPSSVSGNFWCSRNQLTSLAGAPSAVDGDFYCSGNRLGSLAGLRTKIGNQFHMSYNTNLPLLSLLNRDIINVKITNNNEITDIINKYLPQGRAGIMACAAELIKAGYAGNARL